MQRQNQVVQQTLHLLTNAYVRKIRIIRFLYGVALMLPVGWVALIFSGLSSPPPSFRYQSALFVWGFLLLLYVLPSLLAQAHNQLGERMIEQIRNQQLIARGHWPDDLHELLHLMGRVGWPRDEELLLWWWGETYPILVRWLPRLQPGELDPAECRTLRKLLRLSHEYGDLPVAILLALGTAGDTKVRRIARRLSRHSPDERVREAALECLKGLDITG